MVYLTFTHAGMDFRIEAEINEDGCLDEIWNPTIWNTLKRVYEPISCDIKAFEKGMEDEINKAVEEYKENKRLFYADLAYEQKREAKHGF